MADRDACGGGADDDDDDEVANWDDDGDANDDGEDKNSVVPLLYPAADATGGQMRS